MFRLFINNEEYTDYIVSNPEISGQFVEDTIIGNTPSLALNLTLDNTDKIFDNLLDFACDEKILELEKNNWFDDGMCGNLRHNRHCIGRRKTG